MRWLVQLMSGNIISQAIALASYPIITRTYLPSDFAKLGLYSLIVSILSIFIGLKSDSLINTINNNQLNSHLERSIRINLIGSIPLIVLGLILSVIEKDIFYAFLAPAALLTSIYLTLTNYHTKLGDVKKLNFSKFYQASFSSIAIIVLGLVKPVPANLYIGYILNQGIGTKILWQSIGRAGLDLKASFRNDIIEIKRYLPAHLFFIRNSILGTIIPYYLLIVYAITSSRDEMGYFAVGTQIIGIPQGIIRKSASQYIVYVFSKNSDMDHLYKSYIRLITISLIAVSLLIPAAYFSGPIINYILGPSWSNSHSTLFLILIILTIDYFIFINFQYSSLMNYIKMSSIFDYARLSLFCASIIYVSITKNEESVLYYTLILAFISLCFILLTLAKYRRIGAQKS